MSKIKKDLEEINELFNSGKKDIAFSKIDIDLPNSVDLLVSVSVFALAFSMKYRAFCNLELYVLSSLSRDCWSPISTNICSKK